MVIKICNIFIVFFILITTQILYAENDVRILYARTLVFDDVIIITIEVENRSTGNIYLLLDYNLQSIEFRKEEKSFFVTISGEPRSLEYNGFIPSDVMMPNINVIASRNRQLIRIIFMNYKHTLPTDRFHTYTVIDGMRYFISEPPAYDFSGVAIGNHGYRLYSEFFKSNSYLLRSCISFNSDELLFPRKVSSEKKSEEE